MNFEQLMQKMSETVQTGRSFGPVIETEGCTLVPVAYVVGGGGGGESEKDGAGSGFGFVSIPVGAYVVKDGQVRFKPSIDVTYFTLILAGLWRGIHRRRRRRD